jgi:glycosyltransferase involved in cell wall biosynthesis
MKIVFMAPFGIRPKGTVLARMIPLAVELQQLGHRVTIVAPPYTNPEDSGVVENIRGVKLVNINLGPKHKVLAVPFLVGRIFRAALKEEPDLIHLFKPKGYPGLAGMLMLLLKSLGLRMPPLFLDADDWEGGMNAMHPYSALEKRLYCCQEQWLPPRVAGVTSASIALRGMFASMGIDGGRLLYLPNCAGEVKQGDGGAARKRLGIGADEVVLLLYTRFFEFSQEKLHLILREIHRQVPLVRFLVVGKGRNNEEALLQTAALDGGFSTSLTIAGWVEPGDIPDYLAAGDVAIYPFDDTIVNRCKCPAKLTELLLAGIPVVGDRVGQVNEYINPAAVGQLSDPDNWQEMADLASSLLLDPARRRLVAEQGRRYLLEHFAWNVYTSQLHQFYLEYMNR